MEIQRSRVCQKAGWRIAWNSPSMRQMRELATVWAEDKDERGQLADRSVGVRHFVGGVVVDSMYQMYRMGVDAGLAVRR